MCTAYDASLVANRKAKIFASLRITKTHVFHLPISVSVGFDIWQYGNRVGADDLCTGCVQAEEHADSAKENVTILKIRLYVVVSRINSLPRYRWASVHVVTTNCVPNVFNICVFRIK
jgi:hypothetical protein